VFYSRMFGGSEKVQKARKSTVSEATYRELVWQQSFLISSLASRKAWRD